MLVIDLVHLVLSGLHWSTGSGSSWGPPTPASCSHPSSSSGHHHRRPSASSSTSETVWSESAANAYADKIREQYKSFDREAARAANTHLPNQDHFHGYESQDWKSNWHGPTALKEAILGPDPPKGKWKEVTGSGVKAHKTFLRLKKGEKPSDQVPRALAAIDALEMAHEELCACDPETREKAKALLYAREPGRERGSTRSSRKRGHDQEWSSDSDGLDDGIEAIPPPKRPRQESQDRRLQQTPEPSREQRRGGGSDAGGLGVARERDGLLREEREPSPEVSWWFHLVPSGPLRSGTRSQLDVY